MRSPQSPQSPARSGRLGLRAALTEQLGLKAVALLLAVLLWIIVAARQPTEAYVRVRIDPLLDSSLVLLDGMPELQALVAGRAADLVKLYATPLVLRRRVGGDAPDTLLLDISPLEVRVPTELSGAVRVLDVQPRNVMLRFETHATRRVRVVNEGRVAVRGGAGTLTADDLQFEPSTVRVTGPRRVVRALGGIRPFSLSIAAGDTLFHVADLDTTGTGVRVQPTQVKVHLRGAIGRLADGARATPSP